MKVKNDTNHPECGYLCNHCAKRLGAVWPEFNCATIHPGECPQCGRTEGLASIDDWDWPRGSKRPRHGAGRD